MNASELERILASLPQQAVAVLGDFCLDRYLAIDPHIKDLSAETGLPIHQVVAVRNSPGGGGVVLANLAALGVGEVLPIGLVGRDGEGFELLGALAAAGIDTRRLRQSADRPTPAYLKPVVADPGGAERELSRFDIFPRRPLAPDDERRLLDDLAAVSGRAGALIVSDYGEAGKFGAVTPAVRGELVRGPAAGAVRPRPVLVDSRLNIGAFPGCILKPNEREFSAMVGEPPGRQWPVEELLPAARAAAARQGAPVFVTMGARGVLAAAADSAAHVPAFPPRGPIDPVGAGDSVLAALGCALAAGAAVVDAAVFGMLVASITVEQIGTTGVAGPAAVRRRFAEYAEVFPQLARKG